MFVPLALEYDVDSCFSLFTIFNLRVFSKPKANTRLAFEVLIHAKVEQAECSVVKNNVAYRVDQTTGEFRRFRGRFHSAVFLSWLRW